MVSIARKVLLSLVPEEGVVSAAGFAENLFCRKVISSQSDGFGAPAAEPLGRRLRSKRPRPKAGVVSAAGFAGSWPSATADAVLGEGALPPRAPLRVLLSSSGKTRRMRNEHKLSSLICGAGGGSRTLTPARGGGF